MSAMTVSADGSRNDLSLVPYPQSVTELRGTVANVSPTYRRDATVGSEGYRLRIADGKVVITSSTDAGAFYAEKTLGQLRRADGTYPAVEIEDTPAFPWRGLLLDESRHFWGKAVVKRILDRMADFKLNVFHWHLTDSHGWRLQIDRYPELTDRGARRPIPDWDFNIRDAEGAVGEYGPFYYTKDDVREILAYAKARHIRVIPEIEIPGHSREVILCHPGFTCLDWGAFADMIRVRNQVDQAAALCVGNDDVMTFFEKVFDEVCELFPDEYVHIGGDECPRGNWKNCPKCRKRMKDEGLKSEDELQAWVTRRFSKYLARKGRRIIGWDEILVGGLPDGATVMSWRGAEGGIAAAKQGHCAVVCPHRMCYLDYPTGEKDDTCPYPRFCTKNFLPLEKVYSFDPCEGIPENQRKYVLGSQTLNWGESTWDVRDLEYKMWPRTCANAEVVWTGAKKRTFADFKQRLDALSRTATAAVEVDFGRDRWNSNDWQIVKGPRWDYCHGFVQKDGWIENETPDGMTPEEVFTKCGSTSYSGMVWKKKFPIGTTVSMTAGWDWRMAPLMVIAPDLGVSKDGRHPEFREHWEVVVYDEGLNIWHHFWTPEKGPHWIKSASLLLPKDRTFKPNAKHTLTVKVHRNAKGRKEMLCTCNGYQLQCVDDALPDTFYVGILGCEGRNFFWNFSASSARRLDK